MLFYSFCLLGFWCKIDSHLTYFSSMRNVASLLFYSSCFQDVFLVFSFQKFDYEVSGKDFLGFIIFGANLASWICKLLSFTKFGMFSAFFLHVFFSALHFFSFCSGDVTNVWPFDNVPQTSYYKNEALLIFFNLFLFVVQIG